MPITFVVLAGVLVVLVVGGAVVMATGIGSGSGRKN